jgi:hypothetical protein
LCSENLITKVWHELVRNRTTIQNGFLFSSSVSSGPFDSRLGIYVNHPLLAALYSSTTTSAIKNPHVTNFCLFAIERRHFRLERRETERKEKLFRPRSSSSLLACLLLSMRLFSPLFLSFFIWSFPLLGPPKAPPSFQHNTQMSY